MGEPTGFIHHKRNAQRKRDAAERVADFKEFYVPTEEQERLIQASRCMDCGVPYCHTEFGCPVDNLIPEWNDLIYRGRHKEALERLHRTNNFPEVTGRVCPAPCEGACTVGLIGDPVTIKDNELAIIERGFEEGWVKPHTPSHRTGKKVAVIGSGPAGLAAAEQLNKVGHTVTVYEKADRIGGLMMYGIPNMKMDKKVLERRIDLMRKAGIHFVINADVGGNVDPQQLRRDNDAVLIAIGAQVPRDLPADGRDLAGVEFAMDYLTHATQRLLDGRPVEERFNAKDKHVIVIGGGDTGNDCIGTAVRQGAASVTNFELLDEPPATRADDNPWPQWPRILRTDYGHEEAIAKYGHDPRVFHVLTQKFEGEDGRVKKAHTVQVRWIPPGANGGRPTFKPIEGTEKTYPADLVLLAMGFLGPIQTLTEQFKLESDQRSNIAAEYGEYATSVDGVFAAGDCRRGQSLVVWAIAEGRGAARAIDCYLSGDTHLPAPGVAREQCWSTAEA
jgi:glutamate synthase (NADPH/NADH) small chain